MNVKLLRKVSAQIVDYAERFNMIWAGAQVLPDMRGLIGDPPCKTQACIAGETVLAAGVGWISKEGGIEMDGDADILPVAQSLLKLTSEQKYRLFYLKKENPSAEGWPNSFEQAYLEAATPNERAAVAQQRIEHFIKTKGRE